MAVAVAPSASADELQEIFVNCDAGGVIRSGSRDGHPQDIFKVTNLGHQDCLLNDLSLGHLAFMYDLTGVSGWNTIYRKADNPDPTGSPEFEAVGPGLSGSDGWLFSRGQTGYVKLLDAGRWEFEVVGVSDPNSGMQVTVTVSSPDCPELQGDQPYLVVPAPTIGVDWSGCELGYADLAGARLDDADLVYANLNYSNLKTAWLMVADLSHADLSHAELERARLAGARLSYADLTGAHFEETNFSSAFLDGAILRDSVSFFADMTGADLFEADLTNAYLQSATLLRASLVGAHGTGVSLYEANLTYADLFGVELPGVDLRHANLSAAYLAHADLTGADLTGANLTGAVLNGDSPYPKGGFRSSTSGTNLVTRMAGTSGVRAVSGPTGGANLSGANLTGADLTGADLTGVDLTDADLTDADLAGATVDGANFTGANLTGADLTGVTGQIVGTPDALPDGYVLFEGSLVTVMDAITMAVTGDFAGDTAGANGLIAKARAATDAGNGKAKAGAVKAFTNEVRAKVGKPLTEEQASELLKLAAML